MFAAGEIPAPAPMYNIMQNTGFVKGKDLFSIMIQAAGDKQFCSAARRRETCVNDKICRIELHGNSILRLTHLGYDLRKYKTAAPPPP